MDSLGMTKARMGEIR